MSDSARDVTDPLDALTSVFDQVQNEYTDYPQFGPGKPNEAFATAYEFADVTTIEATLLNYAGECPVCGHEPTEADIYYLEDEPRTSANAKPWAKLPEITCPEKCLDGVTPGGKNTWAFSNDGWEYDSYEQAGRDELSRILIDDEIVPLCNEIGNVGARLVNISQSEYATNALTDEERQRLQNFGRVLILIGNDGADAAQEADTCVTGIAELLKMMKNM